MKDLYKILDIEKAASPVQIKINYYRLANIHHPDKNNGEHSKEFIEISLAYTVLMDEEQRKKYDATGQYDENVADVRGTALQKLALLLFSIIHNGSFNPSICNLFTELENAIDIKMDEFEGQKDKLLSIIDKMEIVISNITGKDSLFCDMIKTNIRDNKKVILKIDKEIEIAEYALKILCDYKYNVEDIPVQIDVNGLFGTATSGGF